MTISKFFASSIKSSGIDTVFGIPSYVGMGILKSFEEEGFKIILNSHEQNAAHAAEGYYYKTGVPAVISLAIGPGVTNAITGIANAYVESVPMIVIAARAANSFRGRNEYHANSGLGRTLDEYTLLKSCTKAVYYLDNIDNAQSLINDAINTCFGGRPGPIFISIPPELQEKDISIDSFFSLNNIKEDNQISSDSLNLVAKELNKSERPILVLGSQIRNVDKGKISKLMHLDCPYFTTYGAKGHVPLTSNYLGTAWYCNSEIITDYVNSADLVLAIGEDFSAFSIRAFGSGYNLKNKKLIQINTFPEEIGRVFNVDIGIACSLESFLDGFNPITKYWKVDSLVNFKNGNYSTLSIIRSLADLLPDNSVFFADVGNAGYASITDLCLKNNQKFYTTGKFGVCGWSLGSALGYSFADRKNPVFSIIGDLSLNMNIGEIASFSKLKTNNHIILFNNRLPQNIAQDQKEVLGHTVQCDMPTIEFSSIAKAYGLKFIQINDDTDLQKLAELDYSKSNYLVEVKVDPYDYPLRD